MIAYPPPARSNQWHARTIEFADSISKFMTWARPIAKSRAIKVLDPLTNRYFGGVVRKTSEMGVEVEMALTSRLQIGCNVRFAVAENTGGAVLARQEMQKAYVSHISREETRLRVELILADELVAA